MTEKNENEKLIPDHEYDGLQELDNPLPGWWLMTFYITIIFSVGYVLYFYVFGGPDSDQQLAASMEVIETKRAAVEPEDQGKDEQALVALLGDSERIEEGKKEFLVKCMACHGNLGQGIIGPNLTDEYWIHGDGSINAIISQINTGVPEKGMPPWKGQIPPELIESVALYIYSIKGSNPPGAKPPQGNKIE